MPRTLEANNTQVINFVYVVIRVSISALFSVPVKLTRIFINSCQRLSFKM